MTYEDLEDLSVESVLDMTSLDYQSHSNYVSLRCPYHDDNDPSGTIYHDTRVFKCWGCKKTRSLAGLYKDQTGQQLTHAHPSLFMRKKNRAPKLQVSSEIEIKGHFTELWEDPAALDYIASRNLPEEFFLDFNVLSCPEPVEVNGTIWNRRLIIPIVENGRVVSYEGRDYTRRARAKTLYPKNVPMQTLFNIDNLDRSRPLIPVEGLLDYSVLYGYGYTNATCFFGASITDQQFKLLNTFPAVILFIDDDEPGEEVMDLFEEFYEGDLKIAYLLGKDPKQGTYTEIDQALKNAKTPGEYLISRSELFTVAPSLFSGVKP